MLQLNSKLAAFEVYLCAQCSAGSLICVCVWLPSFENFCNNPTWWHKRVIGVSDSGLMTSAEHSFFTPRIDRSRQDWIRLATIHDLVIIWSLWMMMVWTTASTVLCLQFYSADVQWEYMDTTAEKFKSVSESKWLWLCFEHTISLSLLLLLPWWSQGSHGKIWCGFFNLAKIAQFIIVLRWCTLLSVRA